MCGYVLCCTRCALTVVRLVAVVVSYYLLFLRGQLRSLAACASVDVTSHTVGSTHHTMLGTGGRPRDGPASSSSSKTPVHSAQGFAPELLSEEVEIAKSEARESKISQEHALKLLDPLSGGSVDSAPRPSSASASSTVDIQSS